MLTISEKQMSADKVYNLLFDYTKKHGLDIDTENGVRFEVENDFIEVDYSPIFDDGRPGIVNLHLYKADETLTTRLTEEDDLRNALHAFGINPDYYKETDIDLAM